MDGLDDVLQVDLSWLTRRMQPSTESHYCLSSAASGRHAEKIRCARVYHINLVLRVRTRIADVQDDRCFCHKGHSPLQSITHSQDGRACSQNAL